MSELKSYVDNLFSRYQKAKNIDELKAEILSNLEAKKSDLIASGLDEKTAIQRAENSITSIDNLVDGNMNIYINQYRLESLQQSLLYLVISWIITIPFTLFRNFLPVNLLLFCSIIAVGIVYFRKGTNKTKSYIEKQQYVNIKHYIHLNRIVWFIWGVFVTVCVMIVTGLYFGSSIWFSRPIRIDGPYSFALMAIRYFTPFVTVIIPLIIKSLPELILKYEVGERNEE